MTVSNNINRTNYDGNGVTTEFAFTGKSFVDTDFKIIVTVDATAVETTQTIITDYSIAIAGDEDSSTLTMVVAPAIGETLTILNRLDLLQDTDLINNDGVPADTVEQMVDKPVVMIQQLQEQQDRSITVPESSGLTNIFVEDFVGNAGKLFRVNPDEASVDLVDLDLDVVTEVAAFLKDMWHQVIDLTSVDSPYTVLPVDEGALYRCDTSTGAITINLPAMAAQTEDLKFAAVKATGDANLVTVNASGSELISGASSKTVGTRYSILMFIGDQNNEQWFHFGSSESLADINIDTFVGNASDTVFTLSVDPVSENNTQVYISGVYQEKDTYSVSGTTLTFSEAPPARSGDTDNIEVMHIETLAIGVPADLSVSTAKIATGAVTLVKMADLAADTIIGRANGAGTGVPQALTATQVRTIINVASGAIANVVEDTTPELGGNLSVNDKEIQAGASGDIVFQLGDNAGADALKVQDSDSTVVAETNSDGEFMAGNGTLASPSHSFLNDPDTGLYRAAANQIGFGVGGSLRLNMNVTNAGFGDAADQYGLYLKRGNTVAKIPYVRIESSDATSYFLFARDSGVLAIHTSVPTADSDGTPVNGTESLMIACSDESTVLTTGVKRSFRMPYAFTLTGIRASLVVAGTGATLVTVDVHDSGTTIMTTDKLVFDDGEFTTTTADDPPVLTDTALADDALITIEVDQVDGVTTTCAGLKVTLIGYQT